jgi:hypothetical protein
MASTPQDDPPDGFSAAELFAQGASLRGSACGSALGGCAETRKRCLRFMALTRLLRLFSGVSYTYDDCIFHPGHIFFSADEARPPAPQSRPLGAAAAAPLPPPQRPAAPRASLAASGLLLRSRGAHARALKGADARSAGVPATAVVVWCFAAG